MCSITRYFDDVSFVAHHTAHNLHSFLCQKFKLPIRLTFFALQFADGLCIYNSTENTLYPKIELDKIDDFALISKEQVAVGRTGILNVYNFRTGSLEHRPISFLSGSQFRDIQAHNEKIYFLYGGCLYGINHAGTTLWRFDAKLIFTARHIGDNKILVHCINFGLFYWNVLDATTGANITSFLSRPNHRPIAANDKYIVTLHPRREVTVFDKPSGVALRTEQENWTTAIVENNTYGTQIEGHAMAFRDIESRTRIGLDLDADCITFFGVDGKVVAVDNQGQLFIFDYLKGKRENLVKLESVPICIKPLRTEINT